MTALYDPTEERWRLVEIKLADAADWSRHVAQSVEHLAHYGKESTELIDVNLSTMVLIMARRAQEMVESLRRDMSELVSVLEESLEDVRRQLE